MRVSTRVEYGLIALTDIVINSEKGESVSAPDIAKRQNISHKYLEQILLLLRQAGFISAQKGLRGGYVLACSPDKITLSDVLNALDQNILADMDTHGNPDALGSVINECFWEKINRSLHRYADDLKLSDFADQCRSRISDNWDLYMI
ncbi:MAG: Rrf2 family transcriptional regulator [Lachnospiraceae bacterium]|nr:Rrf2 family transcriptional regulator [Lachnospiraceae bacterium]